jgi:hypothetical protein
MLARGEPVIGRAFARPVRFAHPAIARGILLGYYLAFSPNMMNSL